MKKLLALLMVMVMLFALAGCGNDKEDSANSVNNNNIESSTEKENKDNAKDSGKITIEDVKNAKETAASLFEYKEVDGGVSITGFNGEDEIVVIPETIENKKIVSIDRNAFVNNTTMKGLKISDSIVSLGENSFENCSALYILISGKSLKEINQFAFNGCFSLENVELNEGLETMGNLSFGNTKLSELYIPSSIIVIDYPFTAKVGDEYLTIIGEKGSCAEKFVAENGESYHLIFQEK